MVSANHKIKVMLGIEHFRCGNILFVDKKKGWTMGKSSALITGSEFLVWTVNCSFLYRFEIIVEITFPYEMILCV